MTDSWWLKLSRAEKHMKDIKLESRRYASSQPYNFTRIRKPDSDLNLIYRITITQQPDPAISLMFGDFVHNLRSALDHVVYACVPKRDRSNFTSFPFAMSDLWERADDGEFVVKESQERDDFERAIRNIHSDARAIIIALQPYHHGAMKHLWLLHLIRQLDNTDKHRQLVIVGGGLQRLRAKVTIREEVGELFNRAIGSSQYAHDKTLIGWRLPESWLSLPNAPKPSEVNMNYSGTAVINVRIPTGGKRQFLDLGLNKTLARSIREVRGVIRLLEPYVIR